MPINVKVGDVVELASGRTFKIVKLRTKKDDGDDRHRVVEVVSEGRLHGPHRFISRDSVTRVVTEAAS